MRPPATTSPRDMPASPAAGGRRRASRRSVASRTALWLSAQDVLDGDVLEAGINAAEEAQVDRRSFRLDDRQWQAFQAILDRPVADKRRLTRLLAEKSVLEIR